LGGISWRCSHAAILEVVPTLKKGDVVILDNLSSHNSPSAARALRQVGAWFLFLLPYSPDLNPIEMAFLKLKALLRKAAARTYDDLWQAAGHVCNLFTKRNVSISSTPQDMEPIKRDVL